MLLEDRNWVAVKLVVANIKRLASFEPAQGESMRFLIYYNGQFFSA
jgi:hypothetical protein